MTLTKAERLAGYRQLPQPSEHEVAILRRVACGSLLMTNIEENNEPVTRYCYEDGTVIRDAKGAPVSPQTIKRMIQEAWLIPIKGESLLPDGPPQRYRVRTPNDGPLPKFVKGTKRRKSRS